MRTDLLETAYRIADRLGGGDDLRSEAHWALIDAGFRGLDEPATLGHVRRAIWSYRRSEGRRKARERAAARLERERPAPRWAREELAPLGRAGEIVWCVVGLGWSLSEVARAKGLHPRTVQREFRWAIAQLKKKTYLQ